MSVKQNLPTMIVKSVYLPRVIAELNRARRRIVGAEVAGEDRYVLRLGKRRHKTPRGQEV